MVDMVDDDSHQTSKQGRVTKYLKKERKELQAKPQKYYNYLERERITITSASAEHGIRTSTTEAARATSASAGHGIRTSITEATRLARQAVHKGSRLPGRP